MSRKVIIAMAVLAFAFAGSTFAAVDNIKVSGDIGAQGVLRNISLGDKTMTLNTRDHDFLVSQIRLRFDTDLTEGVSGVLQLISQETWGEDNGDDVEIDLACVELKEFVYQPLTLIIGKQNLRYGNGLIVGDPDTNQGAGFDPGIGLPAIATDLSLRKSFDAVRAILDFAPWTIDFVFAQVDETQAGGTNNPYDDERLWGLNAAYDWSSYNGVTELYAFGADASPMTGNIVSARDETYVVGARGQCDLTDNLTLGLEGAYQFGKVQNGAIANSISAFAGQLISEYRFLNDLNAKIGLSYTYLSGAEANVTEPTRAWSTMWEDQTPAELINILMDNSNAQYISLTGSVMPREDVTLGLLYTRAYFAEVLGSAADVTNTHAPTLGPVAAAGAAYVVDRDELHFGDEVDVYALYDYTEDVQVKLSSGIFLPGNVFAGGNNGLAYSTRLGVNVDF